MELLLTLEAVPPVLVYAASIADAVIVAVGAPLLITRGVTNVLQTLPCFTCMVAVVFVQPVEGALI